jgi:GntR family transcriptional regulator
MLHLQIDPHTGVPVYRQVMDQIKYYVASGSLAAGARLPSIRELSKELHVNPTTVVKSYSELAHEGVIEMRHGAGAFVTEGSTKMSAREKERALRRVARQLAIEAAQMRVTPRRVLAIVSEELSRTSKGHADE